MPPHDSSSVAFACALPTPKLATPNNETVTAPNTPKIERMVAPPVKNLAALVQEAGQLVLRVEEAFASMKSLCFSVPPRNVGASAVA
jgi:hypothetical protein